MTGVASGAVVVDLSQTPCLKLEMNDTNVRVRLILQCVMCKTGRINLTNWRSHRPLHLTYLTLLLRSHKAVVHDATSITGN